MRLLEYALAVVLSLPFAVLAQALKAQTPADLRFDIARYRVEGNTLLPAEEVERTVQPFLGRQRNFGDVQRALKALENAYHALGYSAVEVYLPEQAMEKGDVLLRVVEARIRKLEVRGNRHFSDDNVRASIISLAEGKSPNAYEVAKNLAIVNENPAKQTQVTLRAGEKEGEVEALVEVADESAKKYFITLDNTGTRQTGYHRLGFGYQNANLNGRDAALTLQYVTSPEEPKDVGIYSIGYHLPLYAAGGSLDFVVGYSDVSAGTTQTPAGALAFSGRGGVLGARFNQHLDRIAGYDHKLVWALDHKMYRNTCTLGDFGAAGCGTAGATFSLTPVSLTYAGTWRKEAAQTSFSAAWSANAGAGSYGNTDAIGRARFAAKSRYQVTRFSASHAQAIEGNWQLRARLDAQHSDDVLVSPEQFGIGGASSVRGFQERERADDRGHSGSFEIHTPDVAPRLEWKDWSLRLLAFYDFGRTSRVNPEPGEQVHGGAASVGLGMRLAQQKAFSLRFDLANIRDPEGTRTRGHWRFALGAVVSF